MLAIEFDIIVEIYETYEAVRTGEAAMLITEDL